MPIDKKLLKRLRILYVEDDAVIRTELSQLLSNFFEKVYTAEDGKEGLEIYLHNQDNIDIILSDINMPKLSGIDMVKAIRGVDPKVLIIFATAHSDNEFLAEAIKLKIHEYIIKPIDIRQLLSLMNDIAAVLYQDFLIEQKNKELSKYKEVTDLNNIVIETNIHMKITKVNDLCCKISGYTKEELIGQDFKFLKHPESSNDLYIKMYADVLNNKSWHGTLKNSTKEKGTFTTDCSMITILNDAGEIEDAISIQKDITEELAKKREMQRALMKDKSEIFIRSKEGNAEQHTIINDLKMKLEDANEEYFKAQRDTDKYIYIAEKYSLENRNLKSELASYRRNADKHSTSLKLIKENSDLRLDIKRLKIKIEDMKTKFEKEKKQIEVNSQIELDELNEKFVKLTQKYESIETDDVLVQKLEYWKEKANNESNRVETLEKQIMTYATKETMNKIFG
ncbi:response regulator [Poseidonibacter ostreae]|jgi:PAS domain S-box-containing protein|uniref:Response regulator n=1 Tax=Poseidonibacter ostreae TaxID=2654171 RepID=A0A6L4WU36_9BACT|nr:response regulator [Poseidonibacter ostreae]KAB7885065.1 response regulator [Poseidonibacter ostreae]KAB7887874.1 response regulator [Poseidonibacter ostreae]KAB7891143.1 response regulator [Poseidonibacter ostreae]